MFKAMRRREKEMPAADARALLENAQEGVLATWGEDGYPYTVPLNYALREGSIYFHCAKNGHKIDNMVYHDKVSFCVVADTEILPEKFSTLFKSVVVFGRAAEVNGTEKEVGLMALVGKYSPDHIEAGKKYIAGDINKTKVFKITIEHMSGKEGRR